MHSLILAVVLASTPAFEPHHIVMGQVSPAGGGSDKCYGKACRVSSLTVTGGAIKDSAGVTRFDFPATETTTLTSTEADGATAIGFLFNTSTSLANGSAKVFSFRNNSAERLYITGGGTLVAQGQLNTTGGDVAATSTKTLRLYGFASDGAGVIGVKLGNAVTLTNATAKIICFYADSTITTDRLCIDKDGDILPSVSGANTLGNTSFRFGELWLDSTDATGSPGAATINKAAFQVSIAAGASSVVVTNSKVSTGSVVTCQLQANDTTGLYVRSAIPSAGSVTIHTSANATANLPLGCIVHN
jgi:hypothetical protein